MRDPGHYFPGAGVEAGRGSAEAESRRAGLIALRLRGTLGGGFERSRLLAAVESTLAPAGMFGMLATGFLTSDGPLAGGSGTLC